MDDLRHCQLLEDATAPLLRRASPTAPQAEVLESARFRVDLASRQLMDSLGRPVELTRTEFDLLVYLLVYLLRNAGRALTRDQILASVWGESVVVDAHTVDNFVSSLRRKLGWTSASGFELRAVRGVGYRMDLQARAPAAGSRHESPLPLGEGQGESPPVSTDFECRIEP